MLIRRGEQHDGKGIFRTSPKKIKFNNAIYGPCAKYIAICPQCNNECDEQQLPKTKKSEETILPSCKSGGGCNCCNHF